MSVSQWFPCCFDVKFRVFFTDWRPSRIHDFLAQIGVDSFPFEPVQGYPVLLGTQAMVIIMGFHGSFMEISMEIRQEDHMGNAFVPSFVAWPSHSTWGCLSPAIGWVKVHGRKHRGFRHVSGETSSMGPPCSGRDFMGIRPLKMGMWWRNDYPAW
jgi:hypothetical protein